MKKILALILCLVMLGGVLVACNGNTPGKTDTPTTPAGDQNNEGETDKLKLSQYTIIYPKKAAAMVKDAAEDLAEAIQPLIEDEVKISTDEEAATATADAKEILIGSTNREASRTYYSATPAPRYNVYQSENKIVLAGYNDVLTVEAVAYFIDTYVNESEDGVIEKVEDHSEQWTDVLTLARGGTSDFRIVRQRSEIELNSYLNAVTNNLITKFKERTGATLSSFYATDTYKTGTKEIMLGRYTHTQLVGQYDSLQLGGYTISVLENKLLIAATSEESYNVAVLALDKILTSHKLYGSKEFVLPVGFKESNDGIEVFKNLPLPNTILNKAVKAGNDSYGAVFEKATPAIFNDYCTTLKNLGYTEYTKTNFDGPTDVTKNYFATYVSDDRTIDLGFHEYDDFMYVSVSPKGKLTLPTTSAPTYTPVDSQQYPIMLTQVGTADLYNSGVTNGVYSGDIAMCYVIRLADGSFIVYDTAMAYSGRGSIAEEIYKVLRKQAVDKNNIVISAFILTHPHLDHMGGFTEFATKYGKNTAINVKQVVYNFPDASLMYGQDATNVRDTATAFAKFRGNPELVKPRSGNVLYYAGVKFNVVYTQEDYLSLAKDFSKSASGNASTMVMQMVLDNGTKVLFGGDHWVDETRGQLKLRYGTFIESYVCTLFHHGQGGGAEDSWPGGPDPWKTGIYAAAIKPKLVLWPTTQAAVETAGGADQRTITRNKYFCMTGENMDTLFEGNVWHSEADANPYGVRGYFVADSGIQTVAFGSAKDSVAVNRYPTRADYYNS